MSSRYDISEDKELFEYLGRALYECQQLEVSLVYIIPDGRLLAGKICGRNLLECLEKFRSVLHSKFDQTLGTLIKELRDLDLLDDNMERLLSKALKKRNEIVHRFFYKHWIVAIAPIARDVMIRELKEAIETISTAYDLIENIRKQLDVQMQSDNDNTGDAC